MTRARIATPLLLAGLVLGLAACQQTTTTTAPQPETQTNEYRSQDPVEPAPSNEVEPIELGTIYFDFDRANIREDARPILRQNAEALRASGQSVIIEDHCDERGDEEYNLALGERRATAVKRYLENLGVPASQMRTISYGESRPAVVGHDESAWQWNRRAEFRAS